MVINKLKRARGFEFRTNHRSMQYTWVEKIIIVTGLETQQL